ncbi:MAG: cell division protein FtsZ [Candidatus Heimdallarchaeaceae archaeon]
MSDNSRYNGETEETRKDFPSDYNNTSDNKSSFDQDNADAFLRKIVSSNKRNHDKFLSKNVDAMIQRDMHTNRILAIGVGGAGSNAINNIMLQGGIMGATTVAINTDARHLLRTRAEKKLLIGYELTNGTGAGNDPTIGRAAAEENEDDIRELIRGNDLVFVACGLGKGTGTGAGPFVAKIAQEEGCLVVSVCTLPFVAEGKTKMETALQGLQELSEYSNTIIVVPNEKLMDDPTRTLWEAFRIADSVLINAVIGLTELIILPADVNVDFADTKKILRHSGPAVIGIGRGKGENRALEAITNALSNPLLDVDISTSTGALVHIKANKGIMISEVETITAMITDRIHEDAEFIWGCNIDETMPEDEIVVTVVLAGVKSSYFFQPSDVVIDPLWPET